jgi:hypothetical protein
MTAAVHNLLSSYDALPPAERHEAAVEILRRAGLTATGDVQEATLNELADELFRALDAEEARHAAS